MLLHTEAEAAEILRVSERTLQRWRADGTGPAFTRLGRKIAYPDEAIREYVAKHTFSSIAAADAENSDG